MKYFSIMLLVLSIVQPMQIKAEAFKPDQRVIYKKVGEVKLALHIFNPPGHTSTATAPAIVFFFGGGWMGGTPSQFYPHCHYLASRGLVAMSAEYRVKKTHGTSPRECVKDGKSALRWIRAHAGELGIDENRIIAGGGSAGAQVAAAAAMVEGFDEAGENPAAPYRPQALVLFNPVFDNGPGGWGHSRVKEYWKQISPMHNITEQTPPTVVFLGTQDRLIPVATAKTYQQHMRDKGRRCDLHLYEGQGHGFFNYANRENYTATMRETDKFLASLGYLEGDPTLPKPAENP